jgi:peptide chain release factor 2
MYLGWAESRNFPVTIVGETLAGRSTNGVWLGVGGYGAYGLLSGEVGTHRRVESVKDKNGEPRRRVSQVGVLVWPDVPDAELPSMPPNALKVESRSISRAGKLTKRLTNQVSVTHGASGHALVVDSGLAPEDLQAELTHLLRVAVALDDLSPTTDASHPVWGSVVRSYVSYKKNYVEDHRTGVRTGKLRGVLKGALDPFLEGMLRWRAAQGAETNGRS